MKNTDIIIKYLSGDLDLAAAEHFEKRLTKEKALLEEFELIQSLWKQIAKELGIDKPVSTSERERFLAELMAIHDIEIYGKTTAAPYEANFKEAIESTIEKGIEKKPNSSKNKGRRHYFLSFAVAAVIAFLLIVTIPDKDLVSLSEKYYKEDAELIFARSGDHTRSKIIPLAELYMSGKYAQASELIKAGLETEPANEYLLLYSAIIDQELGQNASAIKALNELRKSESIYISDYATWFLALFYLSDGNIENATPLLKELIRRDSEYLPHARILLKKI